jgi:DMSO reductase family type II enzyme heme b subunit
MSIKVQEKNVGLTDLSGFKDIVAVSIQLTKIPLESQPNKYIKNAWQSREYGLIKTVDLKLATCSGRLFVNLSFADSSVPNSEFQDSVGVFFPTVEDDNGCLTIGSIDKPVVLWQWKNRLDIQSKLSSAKELDAFGPGVFVPASNPNSSGVEAVGNLVDNNWGVVISGDLAPVQKVKKIAVVAWDGSNDERAGIGSVSSNWIDLEFEKELAANVK